MTADAKPLCSVENCPQAATESELAESEHWTVVMPLCDEHARELRKGTPLGPVGLDPCRFEVKSKGTTELKMPAAGEAIGPQ
jgi:hypothetical protein